MEQVVLVIHALWILWMISGVVLAILGFWHKRLWEMTSFRIGHVVGLVATATVPIWNDGRCPITEWESASSGRALDPLLIRVLREFVYWDVNPVVLSLVSAGAAIITVAIFLHHPPARLKRLQRNVPKVGQKTPFESDRG